MPGVDALWVGHFDLTNFMGIPGQFRHPDYLAAIDRIVAACEAHGKTAAFIATDEDWARDYAAKGFRLMAYGIDQLLLQRALGHGLDVLRAAGRPRRRRPMTGDLQGRAHARHSRFARRAGVRHRGARRSSIAHPASTGSTCRKSSGRSPPSTPRATTRCTSICRGSPPPPWPAPIAGCASSRGTASATTRSMSRR